jgi:hypothetical protein
MRATDSTNSGIAATDWLKLDQVAGGNSPAGKPSGPTSSRRPSSEGVLHGLPPRPRADSGPPPLPPRPRAEAGAMRAPQLGFPRPPLPDRPRLAQASPNSRSNHADLLSPSQADIHNLMRAGLRVQPQAIQKANDEALAAAIQDSLNQGSPVQAFEPAPVSSLQRRNASRQPSGKPAPASSASNPRLTDPIDGNGNARFAHPASLTPGGRANVAQVATSFPPLAERKPTLNLTPANAARGKVSSEHSQPTPSKPAAGSASGKSRRAAREERDAHYYPSAPEPNLTAGYGEGRFDRR